MYALRNVSVFYSIYQHLSSILIVLNCLDKLYSSCYISYNMNARDQLAATSDASISEDDQERGLHILGMMIARHLAKQHCSNEDKTCKQEIDDLPDHGQETST